METVVGFEIGIAFVNFPFRVPKQPINVKSSTVPLHNRNSDAFTARSDSADTHTIAIVPPQDSNVAPGIRRNNNVKFRPGNKTTWSGNRKAILRERHKIFHCGDRHYKRERVFFPGESQSVAGKFRTGARIYHPPLAVRGLRGELYGWWQCTDFSLEVGSWGGFIVGRKLEPRSLQKVGFDFLDSTWLLNTDVIDFLIPKHISTLCLKHKIVSLHKKRKERMGKAQWRKLSTETVEHDSGEIVGFNVKYEIKLVTESLNIE